MTAVTLPWPFILAGFGVGLLVGLTGVGGGSLMTPLLVLAGIHPVKAVGTDLLYAALTKTAGSSMHSRLGSIDWRLVGRLATGSLPAAAAALIWLAISGAATKSPPWILVALGIVLTLTGVGLFFQGRLSRWAQSRPRIDDAKRHRLTILVGAVIGVAVACTSIGAGSLGALALIALYPELPAARLAGTDIAHAVPLALLCGVGHWIMGSVDFALLAILLTGSIPGVLIGSYWAPKISNGRLRTILGLTLCAVGLQMLVW